MGIEITEVGRKQWRKLLPLLLLAEPSENALRWGLRYMSDTAYRMEEAGELVGAVTMQWKREPCEIMELAVAPSRQGHGLGRVLVEWLVEEARRRGKSELLVGTPSTSAGNIIFYQKCGFRVYDVRQDYFWYYDEPIYEHGLPVRDMIVFRHDLAAASSTE